MRIRVNAEIGNGTNEAGIRKHPKSGVNRQSLKVWEEPKATDEGLKHQLARERCRLLPMLPVVKLWLPNLKLKRAVL